MESTKIAACAQFSVLSKNRNYLCSKNNEQIYSQSREAIFYIEFPHEVKSTGCVLASWRKDYVQGISNCVMISLMLSIKVIDDSHTKQSLGPPLNALALLAHFGMFPHLQNPIKYQYYNLSPSLI